ncbi:MAG: hypothetical protein EXS63_05265 [Candidatus Omnitrophica bacterium]|nr:hypothetical protein [Candidatus Omnitrophota bacterium]
MMEYKYASGDLLENPNTYFYTQFSGSEFIQAWKAARTTVCEKLKLRAAPGKLYSDVPVCDSNLELLEKKLDKEEGVSTKELLESVYRSLQTSSPHLEGHLKRWLERLIKKFEITKRIHRAYRSGFKAVDPSQRRELDLYIGLAEVFALAYEKNSRLIFLNALLKVIDTLCSIEKELPEQLAGVLIYLIQKEAEFIEKLSPSQMESRQG